jgi:hypothetical protein
VSARPSVAAGAKLLSSAAADPGHERFGPGRGLEPENDRQQLAAAAKGVERLCAFAARDVAFDEPLVDLLG